MADARPRYEEGQVLYRKPWHGGSWRVQIESVERSPIDGTPYAVLCVDDFGLHRTYELDRYGNIYGLQETQPADFDYRWERRAHRAGWGLVCLFALFIIAAAMGAF